ncbi:hypothetical protein Tco_1394931 [Tanacetum coccineum]
MIDSTSNLFWISCDGLSIRSVVGAGVLAREAPSSSSSSSCRDDVPRLDGRKLMRGIELTVSITLSKVKCPDLLRKWLEVGVALFNLWKRNRQDFIVAIGRINIICGAKEARSWSRFVLTDVFVFDDAVRVNMLELKKLINFFRSRKIGVIWSIWSLESCPRDMIPLFMTPGFGHRMELLRIDPELLERRGE